MTVDELRPIIESLIYVSEEPISVKQLAAILEGESVDDIQNATDQLAEEFNARAEDWTFDRSPAVIESQRARSSASMSGAI